MTEEHVDPEADAAEGAEEQASAVTRQLNWMIDKVISDGVGPLTGAITWADDRLAQAHRRRLGRV
ncbi:hypothetical protein [Micrococcus luteus]|uniref:hypothetical protein n=1 Tax=Micrococcus luteus TaxID=1270 RepID=UPI0011AB634E|nr:hypothetical protein [Micrococcus luteus]